MPEPMPTCPFCGHKPEETVAHDIGKIVRCLNPDCSIWLYVMSPDEWRNQRGVAAAVEKALAKERQGAIGESCAAIEKACLGSLPDGATAMRKGASDGG